MNISVATVAVWLVFVQPASSPAHPTKCCSECNGTGMVWSGDGLARFQCPCPPTCECAKNRPKMIVGGTCAGGNCNVR